MRCDVPERDVHRLVREYVSAWNSHDVHRLTSLFAEDGSYGEFGQGRIMLGQKEIHRHLIATFAALPDLTVTPTGEFGGVLPTGKRFELQGLTVLLTRGDEIVRAVDFFDVASVVRQVAPERERRSNDGSWSTHAGTIGHGAWLSILADEDNIGYGE